MHLLKSQEPYRHYDNDAQFVHHALERIGLSPLTWCELDATEKEQVLGYLKIERQNAFAQGIRIGDAV